MLVIALVGKRINGRYHILETIGGGGMANVYKAHDAILNRKVAVKVLRPQFSDDEEFIRRFRREAQAATSLSHPNVVNIYDVGEENDIYYIVMEFVEGLTLKQLIQRRGVLPIEETVHIMLQITSAIAHAHANHIVHRDIKPHNILISKNGEAKVTDFGIARAMTSATITHTNSVMGSVHYLSPEQARGGMVDEKSDIYSLGIVLYEMSTGIVPFSGDTAVSIAIKHLQSPLPSPKSINPALPQSIENIILKATVKDPFHRFKTVSEMEEDLHSSLNPERINDQKFMVPVDDLEATKAIPVIKEGDFEENSLDETKVVKPQMDVNNTVEKKKTKNKRKKFIPIILIIFLVLLTSVIVAFTIVPRLLHVNEVTIPDDLVGMVYEEAYEKLDKLGLDVESEFIQHEEIEEGHVVRHDPEASRIVKEGSQITLYVSEGRERVEMDDFTERTVNFVKRTLEEQGFKNVVWKEQETAEYTEDIVIAQNPQPGMKVIPDETEVTVTYSTTPTVVLDDLTGWNLVAVNNYIQSNDLSLDITSEEFSEDYSEGQVIRQTPEPGERVKVGTQIKLVMSLGPEPIEEPIEEPISFISNVGVEVTEEQQLAGLSYEVKISYNDSTTVSFVNTVKEEVFETKQYPIPLTVAPNEEAVIILYINDEEKKRYVYSYEDAQKIANQ